MTDGEAFEPIFPFTFDVIAQQVACNMFHRERVYPAKEEKS